MMRKSSDYQNTGRTLFEKSREESDESGSLGVVGVEESPHANGIQERIDGFTFAWNLDVHDSTDAATCVDV
jgi:hypothetical protein